MKPSSGRSVSLWEHQPLQTTCANGVTEIKMPKRSLYEVIVVE